MRKRKYLIGATLALAASVAVAAIAQAATTGQTLSVTVAHKKQDKKKKGPADINVTVDTQEAAPFNATTQAQTAKQTVVDFDRDFQFNAGRLPTCNASLLTSATTAQAKAACPGSQVGSGAATLCGASVAAQGCGAETIPGTVTAFNGQPSGGNQTIVLHARFDGGAIHITTVLTGVLGPSPLGAPYGKRLTVTVPDTALSGTHLTHFQTAIPKLVTVKANKKKHKPAKYFISARCSHKIWHFQETTTYNAGGATHTAQATAPCKQKKKKKK